MTGVIYINKQQKEILKGVQSKLSQSVDTLKSIRFDVKFALDNYPENLQGSKRYEEAENALDELDDAINSVSDAVESLDSAIYG